MSKRQLKLTPPPAKRQERANDTKATESPPLPQQLQSRPIQIQGKIVKYTDQVHLLDSQVNNEDADYESSSSSIRYHKVDENEVRQAIEASERLRKRNEQPKPEHSLWDLPSQRRTPSPKFPQPAQQHVYTDYSNYSYNYSNYNNDQSSYDCDNNGQLYLRGTMIPVNNLPPKVSRAPGERRNQRKDKVERSTSGSNNKNNKETNDSETNETYPIVFLPVKSTDMKIWIQNINMNKFEAKPKELKIFLKELCTKNKVDINNYDFGYGYYSVLKNNERRVMKYFGPIYDYSITNFEWDQQGLLFIMKERESSKDKSINIMEKNNENKDTNYPRYMQKYRNIEDKVQAGQLAPGRGYRVKQQANQIMNLTKSEAVRGFEQWCREEAPQPIKEFFQVNRLSDWNKVQIFQQSVCIFLTSVLLTKLKLV